MIELVFRDQNEAHTEVENKIKHLQNAAIKKGKVSFFVLIIFSRFKEFLKCNLKVFKSVDPNVFKMFGAWTTLQELYYCPIIGIWKSKIHFQTFQKEICAQICSLSNGEFEQMMADAKSDIERKTIEDSRGLLNNGIFS